jgi:hypothetical protein
MNRPSEERKAYDEPHKRYQSSYCAAPFRREEELQLNLGVIN